MSVPIQDSHAQLFQDAGPRVWRAVYAYTGFRKEIAEDAVAEAFVRAIERAESIRSPVPWIIRTAIRLASDELRKERRHGRSDELEVLALPDETPDELIDLARALRQLSPHQRLAVELHYAEGLTAPEIANLLGMAAPTVRVHLFRGRRRLRALLGHEGVNTHE